MVQVAFAALHKSLGYLLEQLPGTLVPMGGRLTEQALCFLQAPILERLLCLPECQPCEAEHGFPWW